MLLKNYIEFEIVKSRLGYASRLLLFSRGKLMEIKFSYYGWKIFEMKLSSTIYGRQNIGLFDIIVTQQ